MSLGERGTKGVLDGELAHVISIPRKQASSIAKHLAAPKRVQPLSPISKTVVMARVASRSGKSGQEAQAFQAQLEREL